MYLQISARTSAGEGASTALTVTLPSETRGPIDVLIFYI